MFVEDVDQERQEDPNNRENSHQEKQPNSMHLEGSNRVVLQTQDQERQLMSLEDMKLERQHANQQHALRAFSDPKPLPSEWGYDSNDSDSRDSNSSKEDSKYPNSHSELMSDEAEHTCPSEKFISSHDFCPNVKREEGEIDGDHEFQGELELPFNFVCAMCESTTSEDYYSSKCFCCIHCDVLVCTKCYLTYSKGESWTLRHLPEILQIYGPDHEFAKN